jgi:hypothetical protein
VVRHLEDELARGPAAVFLRPRCCGGRWRRRPPRTSVSRPRGTRRRADGAPGRALELACAWRVPPVAQLVRDQRDLFAF